MGMLVDKQELGFGERSWRYAMVVNDGVIEQMFIEDDVPGDPFEVSDADTVLTWINPNTTIPADVTLFTKPGCPFCSRAKDALKARGINYGEIELGRDMDLRSLRAATGASSVPQVFVGGQHIGDSDALMAWLQQAEQRAA
jgi:glutaredoxin-like protein